MTINRRHVLSSSLAIGGGALALASSVGAGQVEAATARGAVSEHSTTITAFGVRPGRSSDQSAAFQTAIDEMAARSMPLFVPAGRYRVSGVILRDGSILTGVPGASVLENAGGNAIFVSPASQRLTLSHLVLDGAYRGLDRSRDHAALLEITDCHRLVIDGLDILNSPGNGVSLDKCAGRITNCTIELAANTGLFCLDNRDMTVAQIQVERCGNNGIQVWRSSPGEDGTAISHNTIRKISAFGGGSGQNGNGINLYRASDVLVSGNRISDCAFSAVRGNASSNVQIIGNHCLRLGEVALYAEFAFQGALIANNVIDQAATGIAVTNFNDGGRLATVHGNLVRNLFRRPDSVDVRGVGISVEADTTISSNTIENAPTAGLSIGWGPYMRDVTASGNLIRKAGVGITYSSAADAGRIVIADNLISITAAGGIRANDHGRLVGPDLAAGDLPSTGRVVIQRNLSN